MQLTLDVSAHGFLTPPLDYARNYVMIDTEATPIRWDVTCSGNSAYYLDLTLMDWARVDDDWWSATAHLADPGGVDLGRRPVMVYGRPCDVPTYAMFRARWGETFSLGLRTVKVA